MRRFREQRPTDTEVLVVRIEIDHVSNHKVELRCFGDDRTGVVVFEAREGGLHRANKASAMVTNINVCFVACSILMNDVDPHKVKKVI